MCYVTATELKNNLSYYLEKSTKEDVYVTKNNKVISILINPKLKALYDLKMFVNSLPAPKENEKSDEDIIYEEILKR